MNSVPLLFNTSSNNIFNLSGSRVIEENYSKEKRQELLKHGDGGAGLVIYRILRSMSNKICVNLKSFM